MSPYSASAQTVRSRIIENIRATIAAMASPTYATIFSTARVWGGNVALTVSEFPAAVVMPISDEADDSVSARIEHQLDVAILVVVDDSDWSTAVERATTEVEVALLADWQRGGVALDTKVLSTTPWDDEATAPKAGAQILVRVLYRTLYDDPTTPV